jgi:hypothetical protein
MNPAPETPPDGLPHVSNAASPAPAPPVIGAPPPQTADVPPLLPAQPAPRPSGGRQVLAILLSVCLGLFLADAVVSLLDDSLILLFDIQILTGARAVVCLLAVLMALVIYGLMALTPMIPKRLFLPVTLFTPLVSLGIIPLFIYFHNRTQQLSWVISVVQLLFGLAMLCLVQGGFRLRWPLVPAKLLNPRRFSWLNLSAFLLANLFVLLPAVGIYLFLCASLAVNHFSDGFLALRPGGFTVQVRKYTRADGKTIQLYPMSHIGESDFYSKLAQSFPADSIILMEGVTDSHNLLTNKITYKRMANSLGLAEQHEAFKPTGGRLVRADVDVDQFSPDTIGLLNLAMLLHSRGLNVQTLLELLQFSAPPHYEKQLIDDLLHKRNQHLLQELRARLSETDQIIIPWGAAHMPELAAEIQKAGFRQTSAREFTAIRFGRAGPPAAEIQKTSRPEKQQ